MRQLSRIAGFVIRKPASWSVSCPVNTAGLRISVGGRGSPQLKFLLSSSWVGSGSHRPNARSCTWDPHRQASCRAAQVWAWQVTVSLLAVNVPGASCHAGSVLSSPPASAQGTLPAAQEAGTEINPEEEMGTPSSITCPRSQS